MTGPEHDDDEPDEFRPVPHPDDRLWRHPSEIAAMHAAQAAAETVEVPIVVIEDSKRVWPFTGLRVAAGLVIIGAGALMVGVVSSQPPDADIAVSSPAVGAIEQNFTAPPSAQISSNATRSDVAVEAASEGERRLTSRLRNQVATSLPRIQAATPTHMREGSGLFVTDDGHIATSAGLVEGAEYVLAWTDDGRRWRAEVIATDEHSDVAVLQIESQDWPAIALGSSTALRSGQYALAMNHEDGQISIGQVVSDDGFRVRIDQPAAVPGSAIVDDTGAVIAMVTNDGANRSATPAWMIEQVAVDLITSGSTSHTYLGVTLESLPDEPLASVRDVLPGSPAAQAGLQVGDVIDSVNGDPTSDAADVRRAIQAALPGEDAVLTVRRDGDRRIIIAMLDTLPE